MKSIVTQKTINLSPILLHRLDFKGFVKAYINLICKTNIQTAQFHVAALDKDNHKTGGYDLFGDFDTLPNQCEFTNWTTKRFSLGHCMAFVLCERDDDHEFPGGVYEHRSFDGEIRRMRVDADRVYFTFQMNGNRVDRGLAVGCLDAIWVNPPFIPLHAQKRFFRFVRPFLL